MEKRNYEVGKKLFFDAKYDEAIEQLEKIERGSDYFVQSAYLLSECYLNKNDYLNATKYLLELFQITPSDKQIATRLMRALENLGLYNESKAVKRKYEEVTGVDYDKKNILSTSASASSDRKLKILFLQPSPCIRNYKYAVALKKRGHEVTLLYTDRKLSEVYPNLDDNTYKESIKISNLNQIWQISKNYDLIHSHNEPDTFTVAALASSIPVIHDTHDLISLRDTHDPNVSYFEGIANRGGQGRIYSTPYQWEEAKKMYDIEDEPLIFYNFISEEQSPKIKLPKLSKMDGKIHVVYEGGIWGTEGRHRDFTSIFVNLAKQDFIIHIYPVRYDIGLEKLFSQIPNINYYKPQSPENIIELMTQYDIGIIPWNLEKGNIKFLSSTIANKLFEYLAAGLPVVTADITSYQDFFAQYKLGDVYKDMDDLFKKIPQIVRECKIIDFSTFNFSYEQNIQQLEDYYYKIIEKEGLKKKSKIRKIDIDGSIKKLYNWILNNGWEGYDPYDVADYIIQTEKKGIQLTEQDKAAFNNLNELDPASIRNQLNIKKKINAKAMGLLLKANCTQYLITNKVEYLWEAKKIANWLICNKSKLYNYFCWGYPFDWQSKVFIPIDTPSSVVTSVVGDGFFSLYSITKDNEYLEVIRSICEFFVNELNIDKIDEDKICFSYTPIDDFHVHNANLFVAEFLARVGALIDNEEYLNLSIRAVNYALSEQNQDGSIFYWGKIQNYSNPNALDSYHSGFEIRCLYGVYCITGIEYIKEGYEKYLNYYLDNYINDDGKVYRFPKFRNTSTVNIHGVAEAVLMLSTLLPEYQKLYDTLVKIVEWAVKTFQHGEGWFGYSILNNHKVMFPYLRWGEAWILRALIEYKKATEIINGDYGFYNKNYSSFSKKGHNNKRIYDQLFELYRLNKKYKLINDNIIPVEQHEVFNTIINKEIGKEITLEEFYTIMKDGYSFREFCNSIGLNEFNYWDKYYKDYQIALPDASEYNYGSYEWSEALYQRSKTDPWGQDWRASQLVRLLKAKQLLLTNIDPISINNTLDIGCALGTFIEFLSDSLLNSSFTGIDISDEAIRKCKEKNPQYTFISDSLPKLSTQKLNEFDLITALEVICYVGEEQLNNALKRLKNLLRKDGFLLISIYLNQPPFYIAENFEKFVSQEFKVIDKEIRFHKSYYNFETPIRTNIELLLNNPFNIEEDKVVQTYIESGFNLLKDVPLLEKINSHEKNNNNQKAISHVILLAQKK